MAKGIVYTFWRRLKSKGIKPPITWCSSHCLPFQCIYFDYSLSSSFPPSSSLWNNTIFSLNGIKQRLASLFYNKPDSEYFQLHWRKDLCRTYSALKLQNKTSCRTKAAMEGKKTKGCGHVPTKSFTETSGGPGSSRGHSLQTPDTGWYFLCITNIFQHQF